jgi:trehalose synthase
MLSRFDPWAVSCGVFGVFAVLMRVFPALRLMLMGGGADDDPETQSCYQSIIAYAGDRSDVLILWGQNGVSSPEINAFQQAASVVVQKSIREGFGLVVSEALWKGCPVVGSDVGGIALQVLHNRTGFLAKSLNEWVESIACLLRDRQTAYRFGSAGRRHVQKRFLVTRYLHDYLRIFQALIPK